MPKIETLPVESSNIKAIGYDGETKTVQVDFKSGGRWQYENVPPAKYLDFLKAESVGKFFAAEIKPYHAGRKLADGE